MGESVKTDPQKNSGLTRQELRELESKEKTAAQRLAEKVILFFPNVCGLIAVSEYMLIPGQQYEPESVYISGIPYTDDDLL